MRDYGKVHSSFWSSTNIRSMSEDGRTLAMYLLTCPHGTISGVFRLPDGYASEDLQWDSERVQKGFKELLANGFANRCETTKWVWIIKHFEWNPPENPNQRKSAAKVALQIPDSCCWKLDFIRVCGDVLGLFSANQRNPSETLPKPFLNQEQEQEQDSKPPSSFANAQEEPPPPAAKKPRQSNQSPGSTTFKAWLASLKASGEKAISDYKPVWEYAKRVGVPDDWIQIAWLKFRDRYEHDEKARRKRYKDWRRVFLNAIEGNWLKLWAWSDREDGYVLTTVGRQADIDTREAA